MVDSTELRKVLVLYTGGTVGMKRNHQGGNYYYTISATACKTTIFFSFGTGTGCSKQQN